MRHIKLYEEFSEYSPDGVTLSGRIPVYHFTDYDMGEYAVLDPNETVNKRNFWSNNDYKRSDFPRVFYFTDIKNVETAIKNSSKYLYRGFVKGERILHLKNTIDAYNIDKNSLKEQNIKAYESIHNFMVGLALNFDVLFRDVSLNFDGIYYDVRVPIINLFIPLEVENIGKDIDAKSVA